MDYSKILKTEELRDLNLRAIYQEKGYERFLLKRFEDYDLYTRNRDFIPGEDIITLTGPDGKLMALRPDITLSIAKTFRDSSKEVKKYYYSEAVYRMTEGELKEFKQTGLECMGEITEDIVSEVLELAGKSLNSISEDFLIDLSHIGLIQSFLKDIPAETGKKVMEALSDKNGPLLEEMIVNGEVPEEEGKRLFAISNLPADFDEALKIIEGLNPGDEEKEFLKELEAAYRDLEKAGFGNRTFLDFSIVNDMSYYSGILFKGYIKGIPRGVLSGGRYDGVLGKMGKKGGAIGFAVYMDALEDEKTSLKEEDEFLKVALPKGRLGQKVYKMFEEAGYSCPDMDEDSRKLVFTNPDAGISFFWVKPSDVTSYVERGAADIGACGKDIILEKDPDLYEVLDLKEGKCRMCVAGEKGKDTPTSGPLKVATKFPEIAKKYYSGESRDIDLIQLNGSIELAPLLGLSDVIVDIVETGTTLRENNLEVKEEICDISCRLIANKASSKFKREKVKNLIDALRKEIEDKE